MIAAGMTSIDRLAENERLVVPLNPKMTARERFQLSPKYFIRQLTYEEKIIFRLGICLYEKSWEKFAQDLELRKSERPHIPGIMHTIREDAKRIEKFRSYERLHHIDLFDVYESVYSFNPKKSK